MGGKYKITVIQKKTNSGDDNGPGPTPMVTRSFVRFPARNTFIWLKIENGSKKLSKCK